ncbi:MAG: transcriptional regulator GcvA [Gammaproteobacteria bacterium]|nr:transcriptional regulator GcvA [Gammaproteobacteria bacterium]
MSRRLPPLNALRAFEAAARHSSLSQAARELHVTPAAVSHQVKALEAQLGTRLLVRVSRGVTLSEAGKQLAPSLTEAFNRMTDAVQQLSVFNQRRALTVSVAPSLGGKWLIPKLETFGLRHPDVAVRIDASNALVDLDREGVDMAIRYGRGDYPGLEVECLIAETAFPVCSPRLLERGPKLASPVDLARHTLIHTEYDGSSAHYPDWSMWLNVVGLPELQGQRELCISLASMAVDAAVAGQGVLLVGRSLVQQDLDAGRLVRLFDASVSTDIGYFLVRSPRRPVSDSLQAFIAWLKDEAQGLCASTTAA